MTRPRNRLELADGQWVEFVDPDDMTQGARDDIEDELFDLAPAVRDALVDARTNPDVALEVLARMDRNAARTMRRINQLLAVGLIVEWSFPTPPSIDGLRQMRAADYAALMTEAAKAITAIIPVDFDPVPSELAEPGNPT